VAQHFLLSATARDLSLTGLFVNTAYHSKRTVQMGEFDAGRATAMQPMPGTAYPARRKYWRASSCFWPSQIFVASSAEL
jgi:hypothetical protein